MGSQQFLYIVLSVILVGVAIAVAISLFKANTIESSRNAIIQDLLSLASIARQYYIRPEKLGGCERDFRKIDGIEKLTARPENENGRYFIVNVSKDEITLGGKGKIVVESDSIEVHLRMNEAEDFITIIH